jgi:glycosyltransferase involved in cell wall biosynthesis
VVQDRPTVWVVDPVSYTGMVYTDVSQVMALEAAGASAMLLGSDRWMLDPSVIRHQDVFRGTSGQAHRLRRGVAYAASVVRLIAAVRAQRPDVVHWQYTELPILDLVAAACIRLLGTRQAYTAHELLPWSTRRYHVSVFRRFYRAMDLVVVHDEERREQLHKEFGVRSSRIKVATLGGFSAFAAPELTQDEARKRLNVPADAPVALFFGTIRPSKGLEVLLAAWPEVRNRLPTAQLLIAGKPFKRLDTGALLASLTSTPAELGIRVDFRHIDPAETNNFYRAADVVVLPYHAIGTSGVLRYAFDSERAVVATSVGEHSAHVQDGITGFLVAPGDAGALSRSLIAALGDRTRVSQMGKAARRYGDGTWGWPRIGETLLVAYRSLLVRRRPR